jgi:hypothetical protein
VAIVTDSNQAQLEYNSRALHLHQSILGTFLILYMTDPASEASAVPIKR